ncbi:MAG: hypothetical protein ACOCTT_01810 [archaeon]
MALDQTQNLVKVQVSGTHSDTDTTIQLSSGEASNCPDPANGEYNMVWWNIDAASDPADDPNAEIVRVTGRDTGNDTLTVSRGQENTSASTKNESDGDYRLILGITSKMIDDIEARDLQDVSSITSDEEDQITNIDSVTITNTQWGYLGGLDQALSTSDEPQFGKLTVDNGIISGEVGIIGFGSGDFELTPKTDKDLELQEPGGTTRFRVHSDGSGVEVVDGTLDLNTNNLIVNDGSDNELTSSELAQLATIDSVTISNTQWGYLGDMDNQPVETKTVSLKPIAEDTDLETGDNQMKWVVPADLDGKELVDADAHVFTASSSGDPAIQIHNATDDVDMLSTKITIDEGDKDSVNASTQPSIDTSNDDVSEADEIRIDVDEAGTDTTGLEIRLSFR